MLTTTRIVVDKARLDLYLVGKWYNASYSAWAHVTMT